ncbi:MAG: phage portal protein [Thermoplasmata archaeon]
MKNKKSKSNSKYSKISKVKSISKDTPQKTSFGEFLEKVIRSFVSYPTDVSQPQATLWRAGRLTYDVMLRMYERNSLIRMVVDTKTKILVGLDWSIEKVKSDIDVDEEVIDKLRRLFEKPNDIDNYYSFLTKILTDLFIYDASAIEIVRDDITGEIVELVPIDASTILPVVDEHGKLLKYYQLLNAQNMPYGIKQSQLSVKDYIEFSPDDIIYFHEYPSTNRIFGRSPLETLVIEVAADLYALGFNATWFTEGFWFTKILSVPRLGEDDRERLKEMFNLAKGKPKEMPIIESDNPEQVKVLDLGFNNRDMQFSSFERWLLERICGVYQISPNEIIQFEQYTTRATAEKQKEIADSKGFRPLVKLLENIFTERIVKKFNPYLRFDIVPERLTEQDKAEIISSKYGKIPYNQLMAELGYEPIDIEINYGGIVFNPYNYPSDFLDILTRFVKPESGSETFTEQEIYKAKVKPKKIEIKVKVVDRQRHDEILHSKLQPIFEKLKDTIKKTVKQIGIPVAKENPEIVAKQDVYDYWADSVVYDAILSSGFKDEFEKVLKEKIGEVIKEQGEQVLSQFDIVFDKSFWDAITDKYYRERFYNKGILFDITDNTRRQLKEAVSKAYREGVNVKEVMEIIEKEIDNIIDWQAERIARTEDMMAQTIGMMETLRKVGINKWELKVYPDSCPLCKAIAYGGKPSEYGEWHRSFEPEFHGNPYTDSERELLSKLTGFDDFLPHPNCRDVWIPYLEDKDLPKVIENARRIQRELL